MISSQILDRVTGRFLTDLELLASGGLQDKLINAFGGKN